jgi:hypothetical protein
MDEAFRGLTYHYEYVGKDENGLDKVEISTDFQGLIGRLPCKLFSNN